MMDKNFLDKIRSKYFELGVAEQKVATFILENQKKVQTMSITELAHKALVSEATVTRFCKKMSLVGFFALKLELAKAESDTLVDSALDGKSMQMATSAALDARSAIDLTLSALTEEDIREATEMIENAEHVMSVGYGSTYIIANEFTNVFSNASLKFSSVTDVHMQTATLSLMTENDLLVLFSYSGATVEGTELLKNARKNKVKTLLITHFGESPSACHADKVLCYGFDENPYNPGSVPVRIAELFLIDLIWREFYRRNKELCDENIRKKTDALAKKHI